MEQPAEETLKPENPQSEGENLKDDKADGRKRRKLEPTLISTTDLPAPLGGNLPALLGEKTEKEEKAEEKVEEKEGEEEELNLTTTGACEEDQGAEIEDFEGKDGEKAAIDEILGIGEEDDIPSEIEDLFYWKAGAYTCHDLVYQLIGNESYLSVDFVIDKNNRYHMPLVIASASGDSGKSKMQMVDMNFHLDTYIKSGWHNYSCGSEGVGFRPPEEGQPCLKIIHSFELEGDINKCKASPCGNFAATLSGAGTVSLHCLTEGKTIWSKNAHEAEGFALQWAGKKRLYTGSNDGRVIRWTVQTQEYEQVLKREQPVNDIAIKSKFEVLFAADDGCGLLDCREKPYKITNFGGCKGGNAIDWRSKEGWALVGAADSTVLVYDIREFSRPMRELRVADGSKNHPGVELAQVRFCPFRVDMYATARGQRINIWTENQSAGGPGYERVKRDEEKVRKRKKMLSESESEDCEPIPSELLFTYSGHIDTVMDMAWAPDDWYVIASVGLDGLHIWQMSTQFYSDDLDEPSSDEPEKSDDPADPATASGQACSSTGQ